MNWYILQVPSGSENKIRDLIISTAAKQGISDAFGEIVLPSAEQHVLKRGKEVAMDKKLLPGYIMIKMDLHDQSLNVIKSLNKIVKFLGLDKTPVPVEESEIKRVLDRAKDASITKVKADYSIGDELKVMSGPFDGLVGKISAIDYERSKLTLDVSIFGRMTPLELWFNQVAKV